MFQCPVCLLQGSFGPKGVSGRAGKWGRDGQPGPDGTPGPPGLHGLKVRDSTCVLQVFPQPPMYHAGSQIQRGQILPYILNTGYPVDILCIMCTNESIVVLTDTFLLHNSRVPGVTKESVPLLERRGKRYGTSQAKPLTLYCHPSIDTFPSIHLCDITKWIACQ